MASLILAVLTLPVLVATAQIPVGIVTATGVMRTARSQHTATLLANGRVLVAGGDTATAELYNPATRAWSPTGSLHNNLVQHTATLLANGKVLVTGGWVNGTGAIASAEYYDPATGIWHVTTPMSTPRCLHTSTLLPDGRVIVIGGYSTASVPTGTSIDTTEIYDPTTGGWSFGPPLNTARRRHVIAPLPDGTLLIIGGIDATDNSITDVEVYDPALGMIAVANPLTHPRHNPTATVLNDGTVLVTGGDVRDPVANTNSPTNTVERYDPVALGWSDGPSLDSARHGHTATLLGDGKVFVYGGGDGTYLVDTSQTFDPAANQWLPGVSFKPGCESHTATPLPYGQVLIAGGLNGPNDVKNAEIFNSLPGAPVPSGLFQGLIQTDGIAAPASLATEGLFTATVVSNGAFTAKIVLDGQTLSVTGLFDGYGTARFGEGEATTLVVQRPGKPAFTLALATDLNPTDSGTLSGTITQSYRSTVTAVSYVNATAPYTSGSPATGRLPFPVSWSGVYTWVLPASSISLMPMGFTTADYPQGSGFGTARITTSGSVTLSGKLADGTAFTYASTVFGPPPTAGFPLFLPLYSLGGFFSASIGVSDDGNGNASPFANTGEWARPYLSGEYYPYGWPEVMPMTLTGAKYVVTPGQSCLYGLVDGIAQLAFSTPADFLGNPGTPLLHDINLSTADRVTRVDPTDTGFTCTVTRSTGLFSGSFTASNGTKPAFQGVILQYVPFPNGATPGGYGFYLTPAPRLIDYQGKSGAVGLTPQ